MAQDFSILLGTQVNTKTAQQQIDAFIKDSKNRNINIKVNADTKSIQTLESNLKNVSESAKQATSKLSVDPKVEQTWRNLTTVTTSYVDAQGNLHSKINTVNRDLSQSTEYVKTYATSFGKANNSLNEFKTNVENANSLLQRLKDTHPFEGITTNCERGKVAVEDLNTTVAKASTTMNDFSFSFGKLGSSIIDATKKVALFKVSTTFVSAFYNSLNEAVEVVKDYNATMTEFLKVTTLSADGVKELESSLTNIGEKVGRTRNELLGISTELTKAGFQSKQELETLSELVAMYQNTADEELSVAEASSVLISMMKAFNIEADDAIHITDAINQVSQDFAVSSGDLGKGLTQAGAALATYGNSFDETIGLLTGGTEIDLFI